MRFGEILKIKRLQMGWTQQQLGDRIGRTKNNISQFELGKREPSFEQLLLFSRIFGTSVDAFLHDGSAARQTLREPLNPYAGADSLPVYDRLPNRLATDIREASWNPEAYFYFVAPSDEMRDLRVEPGDLLLVRRTDAIAEDAVHLLLFDGQAHLRIIRRARDNRYDLIARNARYATVRRSLSRIHVFGTVVRGEIDLPGGYFE